MMRLALRVVVGGLFVGHGAQKLFGWFGGHGLAGTAREFEEHGIRPGRANALAAGLAQTVGGAALALGIATPAAASTLTATMLTAIYRVNLENGPWARNNGYEYSLVLTMAMLAIVEIGPGRLSLDAILDRECFGTWPALAALAAGMIGATGAHEIATRLSE